MFMFVWNLNFEYWNFNAVVTVFVLKCMKMKVFVTQSCLTLYNPVDCSSPGSSVHGILQASIPSGLSCLPPRDLPDPGIEPMTLLSPARKWVLYHGRHLGSSVSSVTLCQLCNFSEFTFENEMWMITVPSHSIVLRIKWDNACKALNMVPELVLRC